ncbi:hypothetical protein COY06_02710 [Candidatus Peregrinibacteria bacterium CG_4_10_14_0_2_um_filter_41_8]|nr:MAG: hypothetical protein COY06_02710 [Candidatus Peregrinibacteria bacterium CG_4_10_14_0_2_um_filter_41_8]
MNSFDKAYKQLNEQQRQAVDFIEGPVMVLAGPGTGKTQILALRIANILKQTQMSPQNILALTFTESGVIAMRERLVKFIGNAAYYVQIHTFHSFCNSFIQEYPQYFHTTKELSLLVDLDRIELIREAILASKLERLNSMHDRFYYLNAISHTISDLKRENITPSGFTKLLLKEHEILQQKVEDGSLKEESAAYKLELKNLQKNKDLARVYAKFTELMKVRGLYDYDDMLLFVLDAWEREPVLLASCQEKYQYFLVDEYQDTNSAQNQLLFNLAAYFEVPNLFAVGDDDQAIYRFQGASVENLFIFLNKFPDAQKINLKTNYRSTQLILDAAHSVIVNNNVRVKEEGHKLLAHNEAEKKPLDFMQFLQGEQENEFIVTEVQKLKAEGVPLSEIAIIVRENKDLLDISESLGVAGIANYSHVVSNILEMDFTKAIIDFWRLLVNPSDDRLFVKVVNQPWSIVSKLNFYKLSRERGWDDHYFDIIINGKEAEWQRFLDLVLDIQRQEKQINLLHFAKSFLTMTDIDLWLKAQPHKLSLLRQYITLINYIEKSMQRDPNLSLERLLEVIDLMIEYKLPVNEQPWSPKTEMVQLMTAHGSKGLEFDYVFLPKLYNGKWGNKTVRSLLKLPEHILELTSETEKEPNEDERRLFYVALTRARKHVYLTQAEHYHYHGVDKETLPALFLNEIDDEYLSKSLTGDTLLDETELVSLLEKKLLVVPEKIHTAAEQNFLASILADFRMSPTSLYAWQQCQRRFFYQYILRLPAEYSPHLQLGIAVHSALERFFIDFKIGKNVDAETCVKYFMERLDKQILDPADREMLAEEGTTILRAWVDNYQNSFVKPLFLEYNFGVHNLQLDGVPLTGKVDKIEQIGKEGKVVRLIDYKTGSAKSENAIMGKTKTDDGHIYQQLVFYKLMADLDQQFTYAVKEVQIDFIKPRSSGKLARVSFEIPQIAVDDLKKQIVQAYEEIKALRYPLNDAKCNCKGQCEWLI